MLQIQQMPNEIIYNISHFRPDGAATNQNNRSEERSGRTLGRLPPCASLRQRVRQKTASGSLWSVRLEAGSQATLRSTSRHIVAQGQDGYGGRNYGQVARQDDLLIVPYANEEEGAPGRPLLPADSYQN
jgi:hypothetical protein